MLNNNFEAQFNEVFGDKNKTTSSTEILEQQRPKQRRARGNVERINGAALERVRESIKN